MSDCSTNSFESESGGVMVHDSRNDVTVSATVIDEDTLRYGGSNFVREVTTHIKEDYIGRYYCERCGAAYLCMTSATFCPDCRSRYCPDCGARIEYETYDGV